MYKVFLKYPESLRPAFPRLKEKLEDPDPGWWWEALSSQLLGEWEGGGWWEPGCGSQLQIPFDLCW